MIEKCIYRNSSDDDESHHSHSEQPHDDTPIPYGNEFQGDLWMNIRREVAFNLEAQEQELWDELRSELL